MVIHFQLTIPHMVGVRELKVCCDELLGWDTPQTMELLTGLSTATTGATLEMAAIAAAVDADVLGQGLEGVRMTAAAPRLDAWLRRWGLRTIDSDPGSPMIAERHELVGGLLRQARLPSGAKQPDVGWRRNDRPRSLGLGPRSLRPSSSVSMPPWPMPKRCTHSATTTSCTRKGSPAGWFDAYCWRWAPASPRPVRCTRQATCPF